MISNLRLVWFDFITKTNSLRKQFFNECDEAICINFQSAITLEGARIRVHGIVMDDFRLSDDD